MTDADGQPSEPSDSATGAGASGEGPSAGPETAPTAARGSVSVDGASYELTDVVECEVGGDLGDDWRSFQAWTTDGRTFVTITLASGEFDWMTSFDLAVGLANPRTLDEGNPDDEWSSSLGGTVNPSITPDGATGTADVTSLGVDGATDAVAEFTFSC